MNFVRFGNIKYLCYLLLATCYYQTRCVGSAPEISAKIVKRGLLLNGRHSPSCEHCVALQLLRYSLLLGENYRAHKSAHLKLGNQTVEGL